MTLDTFLPYGRQNIDNSDVEAVARALSQDLITRGRCVESFEKALAEYCGAQYAVVFSSGSAAMQAACFAANIGPHDRVFTTANTYVATIGPAIQRGAKSVFLDIAPQSGNLSLEALEEQLVYQPTRGKTVIIPVHFAGVAVDMEVLETLVTDPNSVIIEDACHAIGSSYPREGGKVGNCRFSDMTLFSFHPVKTITTGEGGAILCNRQDLQERLIRFRNNGIVKTENMEPWEYQVVDLTTNCHMSEMHAALGISQLQRLDLFAEKRRRIVAWYRQCLSEDVLFESRADEASCYHLMVAKLDFSKLSRGECMQALKDKGIGTQLHYIPLYRHPALPASSAEDFPETERYFASALSLPLFPDMEEEDVQRVVHELTRVLK